MSVIENGELAQLSVSRAESFDHKQPGGCERKFFFETVHDLRPDQTDAQSDGEKGHALLASYFESGAMPAKRVKMGKAVTGAIVKGELPAPGSDLYVEKRLSGQPKFDAAGGWIELRRDWTFWLGGLPWDGFIDVAFWRGKNPSIWDHKFSSDPRAYAKKEDQLIQTIQLPLYVLALDQMQPRFHGAKHWEIAHHNVSKKGVDSFIVKSVVSFDQVLERKADIESIVQRMKVAVKAPTQEDAPANLKSCELWNGCPHQSICSAYKRRNIVALTPEEMSLFDEIPAAPAPIEEPKRRVPLADMTAPVVACSACGATLTPENSSKLRDDTMKHIGCPKAVAAVLPPDAPASKPELAAEKPAEPKPAKVKKEKPVATPVPAPLALGGPVVVSDAERAVLRAAASTHATPASVPVDTREELVPGAISVATLVRPSNSAVAVAQMLESIAKLLRAG